MASQNDPSATNRSASSEAVSVRRGHRNVTVWPGGQDDMSSTKFVNKQSRQGVSKGGDDFSDTSLISSSRRSPRRLASAGSYYDPGVEAAGSARQYYGSYRK